MKKVFEQPDFDLVQIYNETLMAGEEPNTSMGLEDFSDAPGWQ